MTHTYSKHPLHKAHPESGFSLVEIMVVMVIIGLLTTFVVINVLPVQDRAMVQKARADLARLDGALEQYRLDMLTYPNEAEGLEALVRSPSGLNFPDRYRHGGYIKNLPVDPWGRTYIYRYPGERQVFDIFTYGADGTEGGQNINADLYNGAER